MVHERRGDFVNLSWKRYRAFWGGIHEDLARCRKESVEILEFFTNAESILGPDHLTDLDDESLDITLRVPCRSRRVGATEQRAPWE
jgi:hypothetical protein